MESVATMRGILSLHHSRQHLRFHPGLLFGRASVIQPASTEETFCQAENHALSDAVAFTTPPQRPPKMTFWPEMLSLAVAIGRQLQRFPVANNKDCTCHAPAVQSTNLNPLVVSTGSRLNHYDDRAKNPYKT